MKIRKPKKGKKIIKVINNQRQLFLRHVAQTSASPIALEIVKAKRCTLIDRDGKEYIDLIAGISVCNVGHCHPKVIKAIKKQADDYLHLLVYGEMIETPQVQYAKLLTNYLPNSLNTVYFTNSGSEATEGAMKLSKKITGRTQIIAFNNSYHGSTQGALSVMGDEYWRNAFRPLLPGILHLNYNSREAIDAITENTACVIAETIQAENGVYAPLKQWLKAIRKKCTETGTLLILDEIQTGFGRTGTLWGFEKYGVVPDILLLGKALGGGMPLGAFVADKKRMNQFMQNPVLGHITTFGGHPVCCAAGLASMKVLIKEKMIDTVYEKEFLFRERLQHIKINAIRSSGLLMAIELDTASNVQQIVKACIDNGVLTDWFLFAPHCIRIAPPLTIKNNEIKKACKIIVKALDDLKK